MIEQMVKLHPGLEELLELPASETVSINDPPVDETALRRQIAATIPDDMDEDDRYWDYGEEYYRLLQSDLAKLDRIVTLAEAYADAGHWQNVLRTAATLIEELAPNHSLLQDESGDVDALIRRCARVLALCLERQETLPAELRLAQDERLRLIDALLRIWEAVLAADGEIGEAIAAVDKAKRSGQGGHFYGWGAHPQSHTARVAAAESSHPADAVKHYQHMADALIADRNRESYRQAAAYLARIRQVLESSGSAEQWPPLISALREQNRSLRALREELDALQLK